MLGGTRLFCTVALVFDKYEVAPGYVGTPEFPIPTGLIADMLADGAPVH